MKEPIDELLNDIMVIVHEHTFGELLEIGDEKIKPEIKKLLESFLDVKLRLEDITFRIS